MQKFTLTKGATSVILPISVFDSSSTVGAKLAGLVYNSASLTAYYNRSGAAGAATAITLATATKGTWATGGFVAIDGTNMPGDYELHIPDAALATGANTVMVQLKGAANMVPVNILIELKAVDLQNATTGGLTNLDAAITTRMATYTQPTGFLASTFPATIASTTNITGGTITTATNLTNLPAITAGWLTATGIAASALNGKGDWNIGKTGYTVSTVSDKTGYSLTQTFPANFADMAITLTTGQVTVGTNADKTGYSLTATTGLGNQTSNITGNLSGSVGNVTGAVGSVTGMTASDVAAIKAKTDSLVFTVAGQVDANIQSINDVTITGNGGVVPFNV